MTAIQEKDTVVVFTARSPQQIIQEGGSQAWVLNPARARLCTYLLCTQNQHNPDHEFSTATEPHRSGFLVGKISGFRRSNEGDSESERWLIQISEYARVDLPDAWDHGRNPVRYKSLADFGVNPDELDFVRMPENADLPPERRQALVATTPTPTSNRAVLTIAEAKKQLAAAFGIKPDAIEITIRG